MIKSDKLKPMASINPEDVGKPVDYSFREYRALGKVDLEAARETRIGELPRRSKISPNKFLTTAILVNNNKLQNIQNIEEFIDGILEYPHKLSWIDFSFNQITGIDPGILKYQQLVIIYFHGNRIKKFEEVVKLRPLWKLRTVTFHGNPVAALKNYRTIVITLLPQIYNLDFTPITKQEKSCPGAAEGVLILRKMMLAERGKGEPNPSEIPYPKNAPVALNPKISAVPTNPKNLPVVPNPKSAPAIATNKNLPVLANPKNPGEIPNPKMVSRCCQKCQRC